MVQDRAELNDALAAQAFRTFSVQIANLSGTLLTINTFLLTGGSWVTPPQGGGPINPGQTQNYDNYTDQPYTGLGGTISLSPTTGGTITVTWSWPWGSLATGSTTVSNVTGISVASNVINQNTNNPILQVTITNASSS
ncbi:MAG: hypothetical protein JO103_15310 [Candidatus Eremiobacteraeota bacterium]|nr:hypothetical protein [Candidatus Eremiobacteraeota bacterium]MBV9409803.1 hypothetical protein [Candidatus Eremiobacteraeota bacterium]